MDITERKNVENACHQINAKLNLVSSIVRHDILNKLTIISATISLLQEIITDKTQTDYLKRAEEAMIAIKNQILFTRDFKDMGIEKASWQALEEVLLQMRDGQEFGSIELDMPDNSVEIFADPWLNRVFSNLFNYIRHLNKSAVKIFIRCQESATGLAIMY